MLVPETNFETESASALYEGDRPEEHKIIEIPHNNIAATTSSHYSSSFETARKSLASRLRINASWEKVAWSLRAAISLQVVALLQWLVFSGSLTSPFNLRIGPFLDIMIIILLLVLSGHWNYWKK